MPDPEDQVQLTNGPAAPDPDVPASGRPYLRLWFRCAGQYARAYMNADKNGYLGRCPTCGQTINFRIGEGGTSDRFFQVSC